MAVSRNDGDDSVSVRRGSFCIFDESKLRRKGKTEGEGVVLGRDSKEPGEVVGRFRVKGVMVDFTIVVLVEPDSERYKAKSIFLSYADPHTAPSPVVTGNGGIRACCCVDPDVD